MNIRINRLVASLVIVLGLVLIGWLAYQQLTFRVVKTDPKTKSVSYLSPYIKVYFNKELDQASLKVTDYGGALDKKSVSGKTVELSFARQLTIGKKYSITIAEIKDSNGDVLQNIKLEFVAKDIPINKLSAEQQKTILAEQDRIPYSVYSISYLNFDALTEQGVSAGQLQDIKSALFSYSTQVKKEFWTMTLNPASLRIVLHDKKSRDDNASSATFTIKMGGQNYTVRAEYSGLEENTFTRIYTSDKTQVFDNTVNIKN